MCGKQGHEPRNCRSGNQRSGGQNRNGLPVQRGQVSAGCLVKPPEVKPTEEEVSACIKDDKLLLASGKKIPIVSNACLEPLSGDRLKMHVAKGRVGEKTVDVLRDTGCSGIEISDKEINVLDTTVYKSKRFHNQGILDIRGRSPYNYTSEN